MDSNSNIVDELLSIIKEDDRATVCIDFDGVLNLGKYPEYGNILPDAVRAVDQYLSEFNVVILSARASSEEVVNEMMEWMSGHGFPTDRIEITNVKPKEAILFIDDRAYQFKGVFPSLNDIREFKPWNTFMRTEVL